MATATETELNLPRSEWPNHPHYPDQVLLLGSHRNFLEVSKHLMEVVQRPGGTFPARMLFVRWKAAMHSHEAYEEHKLYPYLHRRFSVDFSVAQEGHEQLAVREREVLDAFAAFAEPTVEGEEDVREQRLLDALQAHHDVLEKHLALEEEMCIPALLALSPEEFRKYANSTPRQLGLA